MTGEQCVRKRMTAPLKLSCAISVIEFAVLRGLPLVYWRNEEGEFLRSLSTGSLLVSQERSVQISRQGCATF